MKRLAWIVALLLVMGACSSDSSNSGSTTTAATPTVAPADTATPTTASPATPTTATPSTTTGAPQEASPFDGVATLHAGVPVLALSVSGTNRPEISWDAVDGADQYSLVILNSAGDPVWAWNGNGTNVIVGGGEVDRTGLGARVAESSWGLVVARGPDGTALAASDPTALGPTE